MPAFSPLSIYKSYMIALCGSLFYIKALKKWNQKFNLKLKSEKAKYARALET